MGDTFKSSTTMIPSFLIILGILIIAFSLSASSEAEQRETNENEQRLIDNRNEANIWRNATDDKFNHIIDILMDIRNNQIGEENNTKLLADS